MYVNPNTLTVTGRKKLKEIESQYGPEDYSPLNYTDFVSMDDYRRFSENWEVHQVLRKMFHDTGVEEDTDYDEGWDLCPKEAGIYKNIAKMFIGLRERLNSVETEAALAHERMDRI